MDENADLLEGRCGVKGKYRRSLRAHTKGGKCRLAYHAHDRLLSEYALLVACGSEPTITESHAFGAELYRELRAGCHPENMRMNTSLGRHECDLMYELASAEDRYLVVVEFKSVMNSCTKEKAKGQLASRQREARKVLNGKYKGVFYIEVYGKGGSPEDRLPGETRYVESLYSLDVPVLLTRAARRRSFQKVL